MDNKKLKISSEYKFKLRRMDTNRILSVMINSFIKRKQREFGNNEKQSKIDEDCTASMKSLAVEGGKENFSKDAYILKESKEEYGIEYFDIIKMIRLINTNNGSKCVHCGDDNIVKYGMSREKQRYKCKGCEKTFIDLYGTPIIGSHYIDKWIGFIECTIKSLSLRESSKILGISHVTLFYWRHKLLAALKKVNIKKLVGVIGISETYFMYSEKGKRNIKDREPRKRGAYVFDKMYGKKVCTLAIKDEIDNTLSQIACIGRLQRSHIEEIIGKYIDNSNEICTGSLAVYVSYANMKKISHQRMVNIGDKISGQSNLKNILEFSERLQEWILIFRGVATKYLNNYLGWHKFLESINYENKKSSIEAVIKCIAY